VSQCSGTNFDTGGAISGSTTVSPSVTTTFTFECIQLDAEITEVVSDSKTVEVEGSPLLEFPPSPEVSPPDPIPPATPLPPGPAGGLVPCGDPGEPDCNFCHLFALTNNIVVFFLLPDGSLNKNIPFVPVLAGLFIAIGGFFMLSAAASPQNAAKAKTIFFAVAIGLVIIYGAWLFINLVSDAFGAVSFGGEGLPWYKVNCALE
jgi:hypothetical protein